MRSNTQRTSRQTGPRLGSVPNYNPENHKKLIYKYANDIGEIMRCIDSSDQIYPSDILKLEEKANSLQRHIQLYKKKKGIK